MKLTQVLTLFAVFALTLSCTPERPVDPFKDRIKVDGSLDGLILTNEKDGVEYRIQIIDSLGYTLTPATFVNGDSASYPVFKTAK